MSPNVWREYNHTETHQRQNEARALEAYMQAFLVPVKLTDRRAVYLNRATQDRADFVVRRLEDRGAKLSILVERIEYAHLEDYTDEIEEWRKL